MNFHKVTSSKVPNEIVEIYPYFIGQIVGQDDSNTRIKGREFYVMSILKILYPLSQGDKTFQELYNCSTFGYKKGFLNYLDMCKTFGFIEKNKLSYYMWYRITEKGKIFLELFSI